MSTSPTPPADSGEAELDDILEELGESYYRYDEFGDSYDKDNKKVIEQAKQAITAYATNHTRMALEGLREQKRPELIDDPRQLEGKDVRWFIPLTAVDAAIERLGR